VIPVSTFQRKPVKLDNSGLHEMMRTNRLLPKNEFGMATSRDDFFVEPERFWRMIFDIEKIDRILKVNKTFYPVIMCDAVSISVLYTVPDVLI
jgi:hypothetical protein